MNLHGFSGSQGILLGTHAEFKVLMLTLDLNCQIGIHVLFKIFFYSCDIELYCSFFSKLNQRFALYEYLSVYDVVLLYNLKTHCWLAP